MIEDRLKQAILGTLHLKQWPVTEQTTAAEVPGWDSLSHMAVILAVEKAYGVRFKNIEVLKLCTVGDLQRLALAKASGA